MKVKRPLAIALIFAILMSFAACSSKEKNQIIKYDITADPINLDPQLANDYASNLVVYNMMEGLLRLNSEGKLTEGVATNYELSENKKIYTFYLRQDAKWENGEPVTAYDFEFAFKRLFDPQTNSPTAKNYYSIKNSKAVAQGKANSSKLGVRATSAYIFQIQLEEKNAMFLQLLTNPAAMPCNEKFFNETKGKYGLDADKTLSNGPFVLNSWAHDDYLALKRNKKYTSTREVIPAGVSFIVETEEAEYRFTTEQTDAFIFGTLNDEIRSKYFLSENENTVWGIAVNQKNKALKNENIRKALALSFDNSVLEGVLPEAYISARGIVPPSVTMLDKMYRDYAGNDVAPAYNEEIAIEHFEKGSKKVGDELSNLSIIALENTDHLEIFAYVSQIWQKNLGLYVTAKALPIDEYNKAIENGDYDLAIVSMSADYNSPESVLSKFTTDSSYNITGYSSKEYDKAISVASNSLDLANAADKFLAAEKMILDEGVFIPMYYQIEYFAYHKDMRDLFYSPANKMIDFAEVKKK